MSDTPETDAFFMRTDIDWDLEVQFAQQLERERDEYWEQADYFLERLGQTQMRMYNAELKLGKISEALEYILGIGLTEKTKAKAEKALQQLTKK
jgi:hypothetical protein